MANQIRRGLSGEPSALDPATAADNFSQEVVRDLYEGLTTESPRGDVEPGVASSWTVDPTGTVYTFHIRSDAKWSNGNPIRAQDFVSAWRRVVDPKNGSPVADDFRLLVGANAIINGTAAPTSLGAYASNDSELVVKLERPAPFLPQLLAHTASFPVFSNTSSSSHDPSTWVSNGAYVLSAWTPGSTIELQRNPRYWDRANVHVQHIEYQFTPDDFAQLTRYQAGQLDITDIVPANSVPSIRNGHSSELVIAPYLGVAYYGLNFVNANLAANAKLRQALAMAIDRKRLVQSLALGQQGAYGFVPPGTWNYTPQAWQWKDANDADRTREAVRLYEEAGYSTQKPLRLRLLINSNPIIKNTAIVTAAMWRETLGLETILSEEEYRVFLESRHDKSRWDVARFGWTADFNDASNFLDNFRSNSSNNDSDYKNNNFDALSIEASLTADPRRRRALLEQSERLMLADYPVIPLYFLVTRRLIKPYIHGFTPNPLNHVLSKTLTIDN
jgi:oligopeptide transport system substrate-binding protein